QRQVGIDEADLAARQERNATGERESGRYNTTVSAKTSEREASKPGGENASTVFVTHSVTTDGSGSRFVMRTFSTEPLGITVTSRCTRTSPPAFGAHSPRSCACSFR